MAATHRRHHRVQDRARGALARERAGVFDGSPVDVRNGFIHLSNAEQVSETAARHFAGAADLLLVAVRGDQLDIRWEPSRGGDLWQRGGSENGGFR